MRCVPFCGTRAWSARRSRSASCRSAASLRTPGRRACRPRSSSFSPPQPPFQGGRGQTENRREPPPTAAAASPQSLHARDRVPDAAAAGGGQARTLSVQRRLAGLVLRHLMRRMLLALLAKCLLPLGNVHLRSARTPGRHRVLEADAAPPQQQWHCSQRSTPTHHFAPCLRAPRAREGLHRNARRLCQSPLVTDWQNQAPC